LDHALEYLILTKAESELAHFVEQGRECDFGADGVELQSAPEIRASVIRAILFGFPVRDQHGGNPKTLEVRAPGLQLTGAQITEDLDLDDGCAAEGGPLATLKLHRCLIPGKIKLNRAHIRHLSLDDSRISHLHGHHLRIDGPLSIKGIKTSEAAHLIGETPEPERHGLCWIDLCGAIIGGGIYAAGAELAVPPPRENFKNGFERARYALDLTEASISGSLHLRPSFQAIGGVSLMQAGVRGDVLCSGSRMRRVEGAGFSATNAQIEGRLEFSTYCSSSNESCTRTEIDTISINRASIRGDFSIRGAELEIITINNTDIGGDFSLSSFWYGNNFVATTISERTTFVNCNFQSDATFSDISCGEISISSSTLSKDLKINNISDCHHISAINSKIMGDFGGLNLKIEKSINMHGTLVSGEANLLNIATSRLGFNSAKIASDFTLTNTDVAATGKYNAEDWKIECFDACDGSFGANLSLRNINCGEIAASSTVIKKSLSLMDVRNCTLIYMNHIIIGEDLLIYKLALAKSEDCYITFSSAKIDGALRLYGFTHDRDCAPHVYLTDCNVGALVDGHGQNWGPRTRLMLKGFTVARIDQATNTSRKNPIPKPLRPAQPSKTPARISWLRQQFLNRKPTKHEYRADPYVRLAASYQAVGAYDEAQAVIREKLRIERRVKHPVLLRPFLWAYDHLFDHGLTPSRAMVVFLSFLLLGWGATYIADYGVRTQIPKALLTEDAPFHNYLPKALEIQPVLVIDATTVNSVAVMDHAGHAMAADFIRAAGGDGPIDIPCRDQIDPLLYAVDLFVPVLKLNQADRCTVSTAPEAWPWRIARALYSALGWLVSSLTLLSVTGILRRQAEN
jgi:hypothetical protein